MARSGAAHPGPNAPGGRRQHDRAASLKGRITREAAMLVLLVLLAMAVASTISLRTILDQQLSNQLTSAGIRAQTLLHNRAAAVTTQAQILAAVPSGAFVLALDPEDRVVVSDLPIGVDEHELLSRTRSAGSGGSVMLRDSTPHVRATLVSLQDSRPLLVSVDGRVSRVTTVVVGFGTTKAERLVLWTALLEIGFTAVAGMVIVLLLPQTVERGLRPVRAMTDAARAVAAGEFDRRLPSDADTVEAAVLAEAVNDALDARDEAEARLRQFVADASHELRTPLTPSTAGPNCIARAGWRTPPSPLARSTGSPTARRI